MVRVGVDETLSPQLLVDFPPEAKIIRVPLLPKQDLDVDFWILPFARREAATAFTHLRGVKVVQSMLAGVDWVTPWLPKGITLCDGRGIHDISTSEWVVGAILSDVKRFPYYRDRQNQGEWSGQSTISDSFLKESPTQAGLYSLLCDDLADKTVLIVGYGSIGAAIEARLAPFGVNILRIARTPRTHPEVAPVTDLHRLLPQADVVVAIVPFTPETHKLFGARELDLMKPGALLVNAARGPVVDTDALIQALHQNKIRAALDVTDPEPLPSGHPLWSAPNCFITPHIAGKTPDLARRAFRFGAAQVRRYLASEPLENIVTDAGY